MAKCKNCKGEGRIRNRYEGKIKRMFDEKEQCYRYQNTDLGNEEAIKTIRSLAKK